MKHKDFTDMAECIDLSMFQIFREDRGGEVGDTKRHPDHPAQKEWDFF